MLRGGPGEHRPTRCGISISNTCSVCQASIPVVRAQGSEASALVCRGRPPYGVVRAPAVSWGENVSAADWETIYRLCAPSLRRFIRSRVPEALVEDTLQDTFVRAYRSQARFDPTRPALPWLLTIARRACSETLQKLPREWPGDVVDLTPASVQDEPHPHFENRQRIEQMRQALTGLSPRHRRLLLAWDMEGESPFPALAAREGVSTKALKSALCRARTAFRHRYSVLAERTGVAALVAWGPARLRARLQRTWTWWMSGSPVVEAALGGIAVVIVSAAAMLIPTSDATGAARVILAGALVSGVEQVPTSSSQPAATRPVVDNTPSSAVKAAAGGDITRRPEMTGAAGAGGIPVRGGADLGVGPEASDASITLGVDHPIGPLTTDEGVEVRCDGAVRQMACEVAQTTPLAR